MDIKVIIKKFILRETINNKNVDKLFDKINKHKSITYNRMIKTTFDILNDFIYELSNGEDNYIDEYIKNCVNMIKILCNERNFDENEINVNRERLRKAQKSLTAYSNKYCDDLLKECAYELDSIIIDKDMYTDGFIVFIKKLIDKNENPNIIKKFISSYKNIIPVENTDLFDYAFKKTIASMKNNNYNIHYYLTILRILDNPKIDRLKYEKILKKYNNNIFTKEIISLLNGNKFCLTPDEVIDKYGLIKNIPSSNIILDPKTNSQSEKIFTIDDDSTKLRDDGLSIKKDGNKYIVGIHIADVGKYITPNSEIDSLIKNNFKCIYRYGNTRILPKEYESSLSLNTGSSRSVISLYVIMNDGGDILDYYIKKNNVLIGRNLSYLQSDNIINSCDKGELKRNLDELFMLSKALEYRDTNKSKYWNKKEKSKSENFKNINFKSDMIIRELMVLYNQLFGEYCYENSVPYVYRYQDKEYISNLLRECDIGNYQYANEICDDLYLDSKYSSTPKWHSGIGTYTYTQSCDPLRKYPDLYNQYLAHKFIFKDKNFYFDEEEFNKLIEYFNQRSIELTLMRDEYKRALKYYKSN